MKVYIHFRFVEGGWGGSNSFLQTFRRFLKNQADVSLVTSIDQPTDIFLMAGWSTGQHLISKQTIQHIRRDGHPGFWSRTFRQKRRPPKIVHRLDGIGYLYGRPDRSSDELTQELNRLSDHSIVQSHYSESLFKREEYSLSPTSILHNGVDMSIFHARDRTWWDGSRPLVLGAASWSANPRKGHQVLVEAAKQPGVQVRFIGNWPKHMDAGEVERLPPLASTQLAGFYRSCDAFLFPAQGEACPNTVLEAIACGLPCLYHPSGGTPEVASAYGVPLNTSDLKGSLEKLKNSYKDLTEIIRGQAERQFSIEHVGRRYVDLFKTLL